MMNATSKETFTWLHLSDFHFREKADWQADVVLESLVRDVLRNLGEKGLAPDAVFVTGDIAQSGKEAEYEIARKFFSEMATALSLDPQESWFLVPGNHDVDRSLINKAFKTLRASINKDTVNDFLENDVFRKGLVARQEAFFQFTEDFLGTNRKWSQYMPWKTEVLNVGGYPIAVICLNSAWLSQDDEDEGKLLISEYQVRQLLNAADKEKPALKVGLVHHPMDELQTFDRRKVNKILNSKRGCQFLLRGHLHETDLTLQQNPTDGAFHMAAGACWQGAEQHHSVSVVQLNFAKYKGTAHVWMYSPSEDGFWTPDTRLYQGMEKGYWNFNLPESWQLAAHKSEKATFPSAPLIPSRYRRFLIDRFQHLDTIQASDTPLLFRLQKVYVPLHTQWWEPELRQKKHKSARGIEKGMFREGKALTRRPLTDLLRLQDHTHFAVSGGAGFGKSTFVRYAALRELDENQGRLPVLLELKNLGTWLKHHEGVQPQLLVQWAASLLSSDGLDESALTARSGKGQILWLLDGLDEIFETHSRLRAASIIGSWFASSGKKDALILTGRPHAFQQEGIMAVLGLGDHRAEVLPLNETSQQLFLENWFAVLYGEDSPQSAQRNTEHLWRCMQTHDRLSDLRTNPLLLSAIATVFHQGKTLPERRANLYGQAIEVLLSRRFGAAFGGSEGVVREMHKGLAIVARFMCESGQAREIARLDFLNRLERGFHPDRKASVEERLNIENLVEKLASRSGLLTVRATPAIYKFSHLGFQEYLAACAFGEEREPVQALQPYLEQGSWREVVLLTAGFLFESVPSYVGMDFMEKLLAWSGEEKDSSNRLGLVLEAAAEAPKGALSESFVKGLRHKALTALEDVRETSRAVDRLVVGDALGKLGDPRLDPAAEERWVRIKAGRFLMGSENLSKDINKEWRDFCRPVHEVTLSRDFRFGRYPVTNQEYGAFIEDGGYDQKHYWSEQGWAWRQCSDSQFESWFKDLRKQDNRIDESWKDDFRPGALPRFWREGKWNGNNQPVVGVSWHEAEAYCRWLQSLMKRKSPPWWNQGFTVVLPTEAQWEYAARGSSNRPYPWGTESPSPQRANYRNSEFRRTNPVGIYTQGKTPEGVSDLAGNVWEWCRDSWHGDVYQSRTQGATDPKLLGDDALKVLRGGSWGSGAGSLAAACRGRDWSWLRDTFVGFRCVVSVAAEHD